MSLQTPSLPAARAKRDRWFSEIQGQSYEGPSFCN
jgi:hypothetical protein